MSNPGAQQELIARAIQSDRTALERLLFLHYTPLSQHIAARLPSVLQGTVSVEDVLQETFIQVFRDIGRFEPRAECSFAAWLRSIAENRLHDMAKALRRKKRGGDRRRVRLWNSTGSTSVVELAQWPSRDSATPSRCVARGEAVHAVQVAIAALPADYRDAVRLRYLEGKSVEETATLMQRSPGAVRGLIDRAKEKLRAAMGRASQYLSQR